MYDDITVPILLRVLIVSLFFNIFAIWKLFDILKWFINLF